MQELNPNSTVRDSALNAAQKARQAAKQARAVGRLPKEDVPNLKSRGHQPNTTNPGMGQIQRPKPSNRTTNPTIQVDPLSTARMHELEKQAKRNAIINATTKIPRHRKI